MNQVLKRVARRSAHTDISTAPSVGADMLAAARTFSPAQLAERMARKATKLQRRYTLAEVVRQYISASGELLGS